MSVDDAGGPGKPLHPSTKQRVRAVRFGMSTDGWAVIAAILLAIGVRVLSNFKVNVPWDAPAAAASVKPATSVTPGATTAPAITAPMIPTPASIAPASTTPASTAPAK